MKQFKEHIEKAIVAAKKAGKAIMEVYNSDDFNSELKNDGSPLTRADKAAHSIIEADLLATGIPLLSEEGKHIPFEVRERWDYYWLVDPLDGTKEFLKRNGEFTVNIALIHNHKPIWGVVYAVALGKCYYMDEGGQVWLEENGISKQLPKKEKEFDPHKDRIRVVASRSHLDEKTMKFISTLKEPQFISMGSSLKFMMLAESKADVYPRYAPTMEWDTAASQAILNALGWEVMQENTNEPVRYNKTNLLNPNFIVK